jgi:hypothetical protein
MFADLGRSFDLSDGITFDDTTGIIYGTGTPSAMGGVFPLSTLYIQTTPPTLWQLKAAGWVAFSSSSIPQNVIDVTDRLTNTYVASPSGLLVDNVSGLAMTETCVSWAGRYVEDGDTMPVAYKMRSDAGHLMDGTITHVAIHGDIKTAGSVDFIDDTGTVVTLQVPSSGKTAHNINTPVVGVVSIELSGNIEADTLYIDAYYRRSL